MQILLRRKIRLRPVNPAYDVRFITDLAPLRALLDDKLWKIDFPGELFELVPQFNQFLALLPIFGGILHDVTRQVAQAFAPKTLPHGIHQQLRLLPEAKDVAFVQFLDFGFPRARLAQNPPDQLREIIFRRRVGENRQHIGERAVPPLLQRLLGDDVADGTIPREQVQTLDVILVAGFHRNFIRRNSAISYQKFPHIFRMDKSAAALVFARALHLHQTNRADVITRVRLVFLSRHLQCIAFDFAGEHGVLPARAFLVVDV